MVDFISATGSGIGLLVGFVIFIVLYFLYKNDTNTDIFGMDALWFSLITMIGGMILGNFIGVGVNYLLDKT